MEFCLEFMPVICSDCVDTKGKFINDVVDEVDGISLSMSLVNFKGTDAGLMKRIEMPRGAPVALDDLLDCCAKVQPGQEVLVPAHIDGLHGRVFPFSSINWFSRF